MTKKYPEKSVIDNLFYYKNGNLYWKNPTSKRVKRDELAGYLDKSGYYIVCINGKNYRIHRLVWILHKDFLTEDLQIDHIDGNKSNNLIENLRLCTNSQNACNVKRKTNNNSGVKNVCWNKEVKKWASYITVDGKTKHLGYFQNIEDAKNNVEQFRIKYHGEFANSG